MEYNNSTYIAHSENLKGEKQTLKEHCISVSKFMREFALSDSFADLYEFCGLIHDMGKYSDSFQKYISGQGSKTRHSIYGAILAKDMSLIEVMFPVYGHHAGLPNKPSMAGDIKAELNTNRVYYDSIYECWHNENKMHLIPPSDEAYRGLSDILQKECFVRILYSSLVDADSLDTERHFAKKKFEQRKRTALDSAILLAKLNQEFTKFIQDPEMNILPINQLRNKVRLYAVSKANLPQGFYSLTLPTGLGKTLCSINWALCHAQYHKNIRRIIIVLPFVSIIDQTAGKLKEIFCDEKNDYVLEHHSNVIYADNENKEEYNPKLLATENWDYPIIVTTNVQFFESLFSNKRSDCRKLHNIQDSVIIFDEIQTLPTGITEPTLTMLDNLQQLCRCSMLFCTATQPDFTTREGFKGINHIEPLVENPEIVFEQTRRVTYHPVNEYNEVSISELADTVIGNKQSALVVFNTKKKARTFFEEIKGGLAFKHYFHLSTSMCPEHRKSVIKEIQEVLKKKESLIVCSTQLIEAGVDMDFPSVYREIAPLESIIQSAGRCNREGKRRDDDGQEIKGDVYLLALTEVGQPSKEYNSWSQFANLLYKGKEEQLHTHDFYSYYYRELTKSFVDTDKLKITEDRRKQLYQTVADKYKIIDKKTQTLFVYKYNEDSKMLYNRIKGQDFISRQDYQLVSQYCVQVYENFAHDNKAYILPEKSGISVWHGSYDMAFGLPFAEDLKPIII